VVADACEHSDFQSPENQIDQEEPAGGDRKSVGVEFCRLRLHGVRALLVRAQTGREHLTYNTTAKRWRVVARKEGPRVFFTIFFPRRPARCDYRVNKRATRAERFDYPCASGVSRRSANRSAGRCLIGTRRRG